MLKQPGDRGTIARLRSACRDVADVLSLTASTVTAKSLTAKHARLLSKELQRGAGILRNLAFFSRPQFTTAQIRALYAVGKAGLNIAADRRKAGRPAPRFTREGGPLQLAVAELSRELAEVDFVREKRARKERRR